MEKALRNNITKERSRTWPREKLNHGVGRTSETLELDKPSGLFPIKARKLGLCTSVLTARACGLPLRRVGEQEHGPLLGDSGQRQLGECASDP